MAAGQMCMRAGGVGFSGDHMANEVHGTPGLIFKSSFFGQPVTSVSTVRSVGGRKKLSNMARRVLSMSLTTEIARQKLVSGFEP